MYQNNVNSFFFQFIATRTADSSFIVTDCSACISTMAFNCNNLKQLKLHSIKSVQNILQPSICRLTVISWYLPDVSPLEHFCCAASSNNQQSRYFSIRHNAYEYNFLVTLYLVNVKRSLPVCAFSVRDATREARIALTIKIVGPWQYH